MGFTRYWTVKGNVDSSAMDTACRDISEMLHEERAVGSVVAYEADRENLPPVCEQGTVRFNGIGMYGHETFYFTADSGWDFCKTARKPYDLYVAAALLILKHHLGDSLEINSDGGNNEGQAEKLALKYVSVYSEPTPKQEPKRSKMMKNTIVTREKIADAIKSTNGAIFGVEFIKKDGSLRKMTARTGVTRHLRGGQSTTAGKPHLVTVFDTRKGEYRCINLDTVKSLTMFGQRFDLR